MGTRSLIFATLFTLICSAQTFASLDYFDFLDRYTKYLGDYKKGEIEIVTDKEKIKEIEVDTNRSVGVIAEDKYWLWVNDAVRFPNGKYGVYGRIIWSSSLSGDIGVAVVPIMPDGKIGLIRNFRHATRSWEYELPRGGVEPFETIEQAALREMKEETGYIADEVKLLGYMNPDSGLTNTVAPIYCAKVYDKQDSDPDVSEAIESIDTFTLDEIKRGFVNGYLETFIDGKVCKVNLRDPFLAIGILQLDLSSD
ncbi:MAG: hypothetical protein S4CHLAM37_04520 [Chlamydiia bacterium]|nr:hypothetical protein [Chlamydiia bacterium]